MSITAQPTALSTHHTVYERYGNVEFNNPGNPSGIFIDYGLVGALAWWGAIGLLIKNLLPLHALRRTAWTNSLCRHLCRHPPNGNALRFGFGRAFPVIVGGLITWVLLHHARAREG